MSKCCWSIAVGEKVQPLVSLCPSMGLPSACYAMHDGSPVGQGGCVVLRHEHGAAAAVSSRWRCMHCFSALQPSHSGSINNLRLLVAVASVPSSARVGQGAVREFGAFAEMTEGSGNAPEALGKVRALCGPNALSCAADAPNDAFGLAN